MPSDIPSYHREFVCPAPLFPPSDDDAVLITKVKRNPARGARTRVPMKDRKDSGPSSREEEEFIISKECADDNMLFSSDMTYAPMMAAAVPAATGVNAAAPMTRTVVTETFRNGKLVKRETISEVSSAGGRVAAPRPTPSVAPKAKGAQPKKRKSPVVDEDREEMCTWVYMRIGTVKRWRTIRVVDPVDPATQPRGGDDLAAERVAIENLVGGRQ
jgi:hypothetical protein